ncbi:MAG: hypothetical protein ABIP96_02015 [Patescibacteria group bacterium]
MPQVMAVPGTEGGHVGPPPVPVETDELLASALEDATLVAPPAPPMPPAPPAPTVVASVELAEESADDDASEDELASLELEDAASVDDALAVALEDPAPPMPPPLAVELSEELTDALSELVEDASLEDEETTLDEVEAVETEPVVAIIPPAPPCEGQPLFVSTQMFPVETVEEDDVGVVSSSQPKRIASAIGATRKRRSLRICHLLHL